MNFMETFPLKESAWLSDKLILDTEKHNFARVYSEKLKPTQKYSFPLTFRSEDITTSNGWTIIEAKVSDEFQSFDLVLPFGGGHSQIQTKAVKLLEDEKRKFTQNVKHLMAKTRPVREKANKEGSMHIKGMKS